MTITQALLAFIAAATILTITPGLDTAMVLRSAATGGPRPATFAGIGICLGRLLRRPRAVKAMDRLTGGVFLAFGARLALTR